MGIRYTILLVFLTVVSSGMLVGQPNRYGVPMITNYPHYITKGSEQNWSVTQDLRGVMYFGNNDKGILEYDGVEWRAIPLPNDPIIRSLVTGDDGVVYVGAESEFGYLVPDRNGKLFYKSLSDTIDQETDPFSGVWKVYYLDSLVYFCTWAKIFVFNPAADHLDYFATTEYPFFSYLVDKTLYLSDYGSGLMKLENGTFTSVKGGIAFKEMSIFGLVRYDEERLLVGTYTHGLFLYNERTGTVDGGFADPGINEYFRNNFITYIRRLDDEFAIATQFKGLVILDRNGNATTVLTEEEGLIDETITYVYSNADLGEAGPVWIANYMGISKLETKNPFKIFTETSGFEGFILDIIRFNGTIFIATTEGLYYKESTSISTFFTPLEDIRDDIRQLHIVKPRKGVELLVASAEKNTYVIDRRMNIHLLSELVSNPHTDPQLFEEYSGKYLVQDPKNPDVIYTGRRQIVKLQYQNGKWKEVMRIQGLPEEEILRMEIDKYGYLWTSTPRRVIRLDIALASDVKMKSFREEKGLPSVEKNQVFLDPDNQMVLFGTANGFYRYNYFRDTIYRDTLYNGLLPEGKNLIHSFYRDHDGDYWIAFENEYAGWSELVASRDEQGKLRVIRDKLFQRLPNVSIDVFYDDPLEEGVWFSKSNQLYHFDKLYTRKDTLPFQTLIRSVTVNSDSLLFYGTNFKEDVRGGYMIQLEQAEDTQPQIKFGYNNIEFRFAAPYFEQEDALKYRYWLEGFEDKWSDWSDAAFKDFTNLKFGDYTLHVKAMNVYGDESLPATYGFTILRPWYATYVAIVAYIILSGLIVYLIIKLYTRRLKQENLRLEGIIEERTAEIRKQKEELTDSIEYASRIQRALLPPERLMDDHNIDHFILFRPRDIVSGDFYWIGSKNGKLMIVAADCTGHGVPGAFMSMLGMTFLDEIVIKSEITSTDEILEQLRNHVISSLKQSGKSMEESTKDGMDLAMVAIDVEKKEFQYSGAYNPLYMVRKLKRSEVARLNKGEELDLPRGSIHDDKNLLLQVRADQMPIGISEKSQPFTASSIKDEGFSIYMFSDGFLDQFGGPQGKKFMSKNFKKLLLELQSVPLSEQGAALEKVLLGWMGEISQIDDILVMGLKLNTY